MVRTAVTGLLVVLAFASLACNSNKGLSVTDIKPNRGPYIGGDPVTIRGTGFTPTQDLKIYFGSKPARSPVIKESGEIVVEPPGGDVNSTVDIILVFGESKQITIQQAYTYIDPTPEVIRH